MTRTLVSSRGLAVVLAPVLFFAAAPAASATPAEIINNNVLPVPVPTISPDGYVFHGLVDGVTITAGESGDTLHYTVDGSTPDCTSPTYADPLTFVNSTTLSAVACDAAGHVSDIASAVFSPAAGGDSGNNGGNSGNSGGQVLGAAIGPVASTTPAATSTTPAAASTTPVIVPTPCTPLLTSYIKFGAQNDPDQVKALQHFLNVNLGIALPVTGVYGPRSFEAVKQFQKKYAEEVIKPWNDIGFPFSEGTGYVYKTTTRWMNILNCGLPADTTEFPLSIS